MVNNNYTELKISHLIVFKEDTIFVCCRENGYGKTKLFLVFNKGPVYTRTRNGQSERWVILGDYESEKIRDLIHQDNREGVAVYYFNGPYQAAAKELVLG